MIGSAKEARAFFGVGDKAARAADDFYPTPPEATVALLDAVKFTGRVWEPACGDGAMVRVLRARGEAAARQWCDERDADLAAVAGITRKGGKMRECRCQSERESR